MLKWTGDRWIISLSKNADAKSVFEQNLENEKHKMQDFKKSKIAKDIEEFFPDAKLIGIKEDKN